MEWPSDKILSFAQKELPKEGRLIASSRGWIFVKVDDRYIYELIPFIEGINAPPYFAFTQSIGAHISLIHPQEKYKKEAIPLGQTIPFNLISYRVCAPKNWPQVEEVHFLEVSSPLFGQVRQLAQLPSDPLENPFHITFGIKEKQGLPSLYAERWGLRYSKKKKNAPLTCSRSR